MIFEFGFVIVTVALLEYLTENILISLVLACGIYAGVKHYDDIIAYLHLNNTVQEIANDP